MAFESQFVILQKHDKTGTYSLTFTHDHWFMTYNPFARNASMANRCKVAIVSVIKVIQNFDILQRIKRIRLLVLTVDYRGVAIPLLWMLLDKRGNAHTTERIALLKHFLVEFGRDRIQCFTADRDCIGTDWIKFLKRQRIPFRIRIRQNIKISTCRGGYVLPTSRFFRNFTMGTVRHLPSRRRVWGMSVFVLDVRLKGDYLILITDPVGSVNSWPS